MPLSHLLFIDGAVPDAAWLAAAASPCVRVVWLGAAIPGIDQIAAYLATHTARGLAGIAIAAHGSPGALRLGGATLDMATIGTHAAALAAIGAALRPGGDLRLYACDVARGAHGAAFLGALSAATGGAAVAAASGPVGGHALGGTWTFDAATAPVTSAAPLAAAALAAYPATLASTVELIESFDDGATNGAGEISVNGTIGSSPTSLDTGFSANFFVAGGVAVDAPGQKYFFTYIDPNTNASDLVIGSLNGGAGTILTTGSLGLTDGTDFIDGLAVDQPTNTLYFAVSSNTATNNGIWKTSESGGTATPVATSSSLGNVTDLALDKADGLIFFVDQSALPNFTPTNNNIDVATIANGHIQTLITGSTDTTQPQITNLAVDTAHHLIYYTAHAQSARGTGGSFTTTSTIDRVSYSVSGGNVAIGSTTTLYSVSHTSTATQALAGIQLDVPDGTFYVENNAGENIQEGSLTGAFPLTDVTNSAIAGGTSGRLTYLAIDLSPTVTAAGTVTYAQGGTAVAVDPGAAAVNPNNQNLLGATVRISGGTFSNDGDSLGAVTAGTSITASYNAATETLTLNGSDSAAHYTQVLDSVTYKTSSNNPSAGGADPTRTLSWSVTDGINNSATVTSSVNLRFAPIVTAGATVTYTPGSSGVAADPALTIAAYAGDTLAGATVTISSGAQATDALTFIAQAGISGSYAHGTLTFTGNASAVTYQTLLDSVAYSSSLSDPTDGGADPRRTLTWSVSDLSGSTSAPVTSTVIACFLAGTRVLTERGPVPVEALAVGDRLVTCDRPVATAEPIVWIGHRRLDARRHPRPDDIRPIRIAPDAFADGVPSRALYLSPDHALLIDGRLIAVRQLVNGTTIARDDGIDDITYYHVELARHAAILAEGLPAESYQDTGNRDVFDNAGCPMAVHPDLSGRARGIAATPACAPFAILPALVRPVWQHLAARAAALDAAPSMLAYTRAPDLALRVGARTLRPVHAEDGRYVFALPPGAPPPRLVSRADTPARLRPWLDDRRRLGVAVRRIAVERDGAWREIALDDPVLANGWWTPEGDARRRWRWTDGDAALPAGALIDLRLAECGWYAAEAGATAPPPPAARPGSAGAR